MHLDYGNREHLCERPGIARIAADGEPGEEGRYEDRSMFKRTPARAGLGRRTAKGVSNVDSAVLTPGNEGLSTFDVSVHGPRLTGVYHPSDDTFGFAVPRGPG